MLNLEEVTFMETRYLISGDKAVVAEFGNEISEDINKKSNFIYESNRNIKS